MSTDLPIAKEAILIDAFTCVKFPLALLAAYRCFALSKRLLYLLQAEAKLLLLVLAMLAFLNLFVDIGVGSSGDFGISRAFRFVYYHPAAVVWLVVALASLLLFDPRKNRTFLLFGLFVASATLTSKGIGWAIAVLVVLLLRNRKGRINIPAFITCLALVVVSAWGSITLYYANDSIVTARSALLRSSIDIALANFPLGAGFATFGSAVTAEPLYYSPLYYEYGLNAVWGLTPTDPSYLSDSFWPIVIAQAGVAGLLLFTGFAICLLWSCFRFNGRALKTWLPALCVVGYLLLGSIAESSFFNPSAVYLGLLMGMYLAQSSSISERTEIK